MRNKIKEFVKSRDISVYKLVQDTGIAAATAYGLHNNPSKIPAPRVLEAICSRYEVQPSELIEWVKE